MVFTQRRSSTLSRSEDPALDSKALIELELNEILRWHLAREANAAHIIQRLSYRVDQGSELAARARGYAGRLNLLVARIGALLPAKGADAAVDAGACSEMIIESLDGETARDVLKQFLLHHAPIPSATLIAAGERLRSKGFERLWQRLNREREKIASWLEAYERAQGEQHKGGGVSSSAAAKRAQAARSQAATEHAHGSDLSQTESDEDDEDGDDTPASSPRPAPIFYNPPQIVRWM